MAIYTKTGDGGKTQLLGKKRVLKNDALIKAGGEIDELQSVLGWTQTQLKNKTLIQKIQTIQKELFIIGVEVSASHSTKIPKFRVRIDNAHIIRLENEIDAIQQKLAPLKTFILPGGTPAGASLHMARAVCRRAERSLIPLLKNKKISLAAQIYLNRLSDYLFILARQANEEK